MMYRLRWTARFVAAYAIVTAVGGPLRFYEWARRRRWSLNYVWFVVACIVAALVLRILANIIGASQ